jgi:hypothetical protein
MTIDRDNLIDFLESVSIQKLQNPVDLSRYYRIAQWTIWVSGHGPDNVNALNCHTIPNAIRQMEMNAENIGLDIGG